MEAATATPHTECDHLSRLVPSEAVGEWCLESRTKNCGFWREGRPETPVPATMALLSLPLTSTPTAAMLSSSSSSATSSSGCFAAPAPCRPPQTSAFVVLPPLSFRHNVVSLNRRKSQVVRMAPEDEKMTRRSPLDFPLVSSSYPFPIYFIIICTFHSLFSPLIMHTAYAKHSIS
nr:coiled-coil domain-containing protein 9 [Ipomoea batatas]